MDLSSQVSIHNGKSSSKQPGPELNHEVNSKHTSDKKVLENHNNHMVLEHGHGMEEIPSMVCDPVPDDASKYSSLKQMEATHGDESKKLIQPGSHEKGPPRKRKSMPTSSPRVLRSRSQETSKTPVLVNAPAQNAGSKEKKKQRKKQIKNSSNNEFSKIRAHLRYLLTRMNYEQNFIDAYVGEGWKGQSLEKIKPEKELERAKSYIIRYKLKIRDLFKKIDTSFAEGRFPDSLYDSEGLIDSEDIFCAKCGQKDVRLDNDIILCDGACDRGFHQFCLDPPLLKEQVPPGDEGWLCPACDCKIDCLDLLNDSRGVDLSLSDSWEKVFPEAVASGNNLDNALGLPSDDSEDDDYNPDGPEVDEEVDGNESSSDESEFSSASEDLGAVANNHPDLGLPSEDSEDDDYDPDKTGSIEQAKPDSSSSDFTSDSEDFGDIHRDEGPLTEVQGPSISYDVEKNHKLPRNGMEDDGYEPITAKRHVERLDYKKLHDETYGNVSSDSSDEDFTDTDAPRRSKKAKGSNDTSNSAPKRKSSKKLDVEGTSISPAHNGSSALGSSERSHSKSAHRKLGEAATQRLYESFKENQYPDRGVREKLAKELNLAVNQVRKWFENARWSFNHPGKRTPAKPLPEPSTSMAAENGASGGLEKKQLTEASPVRSITKQMNKESPMTPKSGKQKSKVNHHDTEVNPSVKKGSPIDSPKPQGARRSGRLQSKTA